MKLLMLLLSMFAMAKADSNRTFIRIPSVISDSMVLQQKTQVKLWGMANPGEAVVVKASWGATARTKVKADSMWEVNLKTTKAGGPYEVSLTVGDSVIVYRDVMLGEVWVCSGQSNMEMPLEGWLPENPIQNSTQEVQEANYPEIRLFSAARAVSNIPEFNCSGKWSECTPQTAAKFSAVGYFFGRKLYNELHVPIGLIFSSWGGTKVQSWISGKFLEQIPEYKSVVEEIDSAGGDIVKLNEWIRSHPAMTLNISSPVEGWKGLNFGDSTCSERDYNDSAWRNMKLPMYWESTEVGDFDGVVWFRKSIEIPKSWTGRDLVLDLGPIDDMDETYVNGVNVGGMLGGGFWSVPRVYKVPNSLVKDSALTIAVRVIDTGGGGGIWGNGVKMQIHPDSSQDSAENISLAGDWKYLPVAEYITNVFYVYGAKGEEAYSRPRTSISIGPNTPTMLFNGMIAPLIPYSIKGVIWYQGESNSDPPSDYNSYGRLFQLMIMNWRADWREGNFPFYWVQIAPWTYGDKSKSYMVRDAQRLALSVPSTGMAVTLDIGSLSTIHPADKQDVGLRLAFWALAKNYHKKVAFTGPLYKSMKVVRGKAILSFDYVDGGFIMKDINGETNFLIAGRDSIFKKADVKIAGNKLVVFSNEVDHPLAVRYTWSNAAQATLFNKAGLPAPTFRTDKWSQ